MYSLIVSGNLAHDNKYFDGTCEGCGGLYDLGKGLNCPKCGNQLIYITDKNGKPMSMSEGTFYPERTKEEKDRLEGATAHRKNGMLLVYRFVLYSFTNEKNKGVLVPHPLHQYLVTGRRILFEFHREPIVSYFESKDPKFPVKCELKYIFYTGTDRIEFQDKKKEITTTQPPVAAQQVTQPPTPALTPMDKMSVNQLCTMDPNTLSPADKILYSKILELRLLTLKSGAQPNVSQPTTESPSTDAQVNVFEGIQ